MSRHFTAATFLFALSGCGGTDAGITVTVRDSAGVRIVENHEDAGSPGIIRPMGEPDLTIGVIDGAPEYLFDRIAGASRHTDGRIVVIDRGSAQLRFYDAAGRFLHATAGKGAGPGEFDTPSGLRRIPGDTLLTWDLQRRGRVNLYDANGAFVREVHYDRAAVWNAQVRDSAMAFEVIPVRDDVLFLPGQRSGIVQPKYPFRTQLVLLAEGRSVSLGAWPIIDDGTSMIPSFRGFPRFAVRERYAVGGDTARVFIGNSEHHEMRVHDEAGTLVRIMRTLRSAVPIGADVPPRIHALNRARVAAANGDVQAIDRYHADLTFPATYPPFLALSAARNGHLWVTRFPLLDEADTRFDVYDAGGTLRGTISFDGQNKPLEIGPDYVVMLRQDESGVEFIDVYLNREFSTPR